MLMSTEWLKINVTAPPEDTVFTGQLFESGSSPSRKVSGGVRWETSQTTAHLSSASRVRWMMVFSRPIAAGRKLEDILI